LNARMSPPKVLATSSVSVKGVSTPTAANNNKRGKATSDPGTAGGGYRALV